MSKFVAVILCNAKIQLVIPETWYGGLDCEGYNRGINRNVRRTIFFSPFGDEVEPDFHLPIFPELQRNANGCYHVNFLQACATKAQCIQYLRGRRVSHPAVYNEDRLFERLPDPRMIAAAPRVDLVADDGEFEPDFADDEEENEENVEADEEIVPAVDNEEEAIEENVDIDEQIVPAFANEEDVNEENVGADEEIVTANAENIVAFEETESAVTVTNEVANTAGLNITTKILDEQSVDFSSAASSSESVIKDRSTRANTSLVASASNSARNGNIDVNRVKEEIKIELYNRLLDANEREPIIDLTTRREDTVAHPNKCAQTISKETVLIATATVPRIAVEIFGEQGTSASPVASTSRSAYNDGSTDASVKREIKTELYNHFLELNEREPIIDLTTDPEEIAAFAAVENNLILDDSDDDMQILSDLVTSNSFLPTQIKFEFDGNDVLSGDIPFVTNVS